MLKKKKLKKPTLLDGISIDVENAFEFLKRYHPELWDGRMTEEDMIKLLEYGHVLFKSRPELIEVTSNHGRFPPTQ